VLKPDIFGAIMDFFASNQPILSEEVESTSTDPDAGVYFAVV